jgi:hypothetical protein
VATAGIDGSVRILERASGHRVARLFISPDGDWTMLDPEGRFDTGNLDDIRSFHWIIGFVASTSNPSLPKSVTGVTLAWQSEVRQESAGTWR